MHASKLLLFHLQTHAPAIIPPPRKASPILLNDLPVINTTSFNQLSIPSTPSGNGRSIHAKSHAIPCVKSRSQTALGCGKLEDSLSPSPQRTHSSPPYNILLPARTCPNLPDLSQRTCTYTHIKRIPNVMF